MTTTCENYHQKHQTKSITQMVLVVEHSKLLFCYIPKVACTSWKGLLASLTSETTYSKSDPYDLGARFHTTHFMEKCGVKSLKKYSKHEVDHILATYTKVIAVRDPLQRLLSAYRDKFLKRLNADGILECMYCSKLGRVIIRRYRENAPIEALETGEYVTETEFFRYLTEQATIEDWHFKEYHRVCNPCHIQYDFIVNMEDVSRESAILLKNVLNTSMALPLNHVSIKREEDRHVINLTDDLKQAIAQKYKMDYEIFGYQLPNALRLT